mmetsp:Transcript_9856/g.23344  ORF Transcript_9856/g.23344 Transcript_9856/m.23344 type:complete len:248 (-) Transcript_9856:146-889(-)
MPSSTRTRASPSRPPLPLRNTSRCATVALRRPPLLLLRPSRLLPLPRPLLLLPLGTAAAPKRRASMASPLTTPVRTRSRRWKRRSCPSASAAAPKRPNSTASGRTTSGPTSNAQSPPPSRCAVASPSTRWQLPPSRDISVATPAEPSSTTANRTRIWEPRPERGPSSPSASAVIPRPAPTTACRRAALDRTLLEPALPTPVRHTTTPTATTALTIIRTTIWTMDLMASTAKFCTGRPPVIPMPTSLD